MTRVFRRTFGSSRIGIPAAHPPGTECALVQRERETRALERYPPADAILSSFIHRLSLRREHIQHGADKRIGAVWAIASV